MVTRLVTEAVHVSPFEAEHTVRSATGGPQLPGVPPTTSDAAAIALLVALRESRSNSTDQVFTTVGSIESKTGAVVVPPVHAPGAQLGVKNSTCVASVGARSTM